MSDDNATWTSIYSTTTGTGGTQTLHLIGSGRYVRMYGTVRATQFGYSVWEIQIFGEKIATETGCSNANAALGRPATASSTENAATPASAAVDGNTHTRWSSGFNDPQWIQVDLGSDVAICQVVLQWEAAYARAFQIQTSHDGLSWATIASTTTGTGGTQTFNVFGLGRYLRIYGTVRGTRYGYSLWEIAVHNGPSPTLEPTGNPSNSPTVRP